MEEVVKVEKMCGTISDVELLEGGYVWLHFTDKRPSVIVEPGYAIQKLAEVFEETGLKGQDIFYSISDWGTLIWFGQ